MFVNSNFELSFSIFFSKSYIVGLEDSLSYLWRSAQYSETGKVFKFLIAYFIIRSLTSQNRQF